MNRLGKQEQLPDDVHTVGAEFSDCERYRYALWRIWGEPGEAIAAFIGMNPSSATAEADDTTVRQCGKYARRWGYAGLLMLNIWAIRGTDPAEALHGEVDPVGPENDEGIAAFAEDGKLVVPENGLVGQRFPVGIWVAAWGTKGALNGRGEAVAQLVTQHQDLHCLGNTKDGYPKHPSRKPLDLEPVIYRRKQE